MGRGSSRVADQVLEMGVDRLEPTSAERRSSSTCVESTLPKLEVASARRRASAAVRESDSSEGAGRVDGASSELDTEANGRPLA